MSRGTIRSVLVRLAQEGYVNRGVRARSFTWEEAADILEARETLEAAPAAKAAERATECELTELRRTLEEMAATPAHTHDTLRCPLVMRRYRTISAHHPRAGSLAEHRAILPALLTRNPEAAAAAMRRHGGSARRASLLERTRRTEGTPVPGRP
ncbi:FCD domain-containing protein [Amycolatopsis sp. NPDC051903]|uniref:FCD domain-containing protein n=1 Tax=Amycolatopsis sp. NPDC051903 TaxID=3363936 RepID=UPI00379FF4CF